MALAGSQNYFPGATVKDIEREIEIEGDMQSERETDIQTER